MDIRFAFKNQQNGEPYYVRLHNPYYEARALSVAQTEEMRRNEELAKAREAMQKENQPNFSIATMGEKEVTMFGRTRTIKEPLPSGVPSVRPMAIRSLTT